MNDDDAVKYEAYKVASAKRQAAAEILMTAAESGDVEAKAKVEAELATWWTCRYGTNVTHAVSPQYFRFRGDPWSVLAQTICNTTSGHFPGESDDPSVKCGPADINLVTCRRCRKLLEKKLQTKVTE